MPGTADRVGVRITFTELPPRFPGSAALAIGMNRLVEAPQLMSDEVDGGFFASVLDTRQIPSASPLTTLVRFTIILQLLRRREGALILALDGL